jgi:hypothetical protein
MDRRPYARTENLSALCVSMEKLLGGRDKFVLVLHLVDKLREGGGTLIAALARLGERVWLNIHSTGMHDTNSPARYQTSRSSSQPPFRLRPQSCTRHRRPFYISHHTHAANFLRSLVPTLQISSLSRPLWNSSQTTHPISLLKMTPGYGVASYKPLTTRSQSTPDETSSASRAAQCASGVLLSSQ